jgi:TonB family protein
MNGARPVSRRDAGMIWTILLSALAHAVALAAVLLAPEMFLDHSPPLESYTVDLVAAGVLGGDSGPIESIDDELPAGEAPEEAPAEAEPQVEPQEPPPLPPEIEEVDAAAPPEPEVPEVEIEEVEVEEEPEPAVETAEPPEGDDSEPDGAIALAQLPDPTAPPPATEAAAAPTVKAAPPAPVPPPTRKPNPVATARPKPTRVPSTATPSSGEKIAAAVRKRAARVEKAEGDDQRIAAAVLDRARRVEGAVGGSTPGPLGSGPGQGAGGVVHGIEYILYKRRMEARIRDTWAWAGVDDSLVAVVRFSVGPNGKISKIRTTSASDDPAYDASVERAIRASSPLDPVPQQYRVEFGDVELTFRATDLKR